MTIKLYDFVGNPTNVDVGDISDIEMMVIKVCGGNESLAVLYKHGTIKEFQARYDRLMDRLDDKMVIYDIRGINRITEVNERPKPWIWVS